MGEKERGGREDEEAEEGCLLSFVPDPSVMRMTNDLVFF